MLCMNLDLSLPQSDVHGRLGLRMPTVAYMSKQPLVIQEALAKCWTQTQLSHNK